MYRKYTDYFIKSISIKNISIHDNERRTIYLPGRVKKISMLTVGDIQIFKSVVDIFIKSKIRVEKRIKK